MDYQIKYGFAGDSRHITTARKWGKRMVLTLIVLLICAAALWSFGGDWAVTVDALESMAGRIQDGANMQEAFSSFCSDILQGVEFG